MTFHYFKDYFMILNIIQLENQNTVEYEDDIKAVLKCI